MNITFKNTFFKYKNLFIYGFSLISACVGIGLNFFLAKVLEAEKYGELQFYVSLSVLLANIFIFGLNSFLIREAKNNEQKSNVLNKCFTLYFLIFLFVLPIVFFVLYNFVSRTSSNAFLIFAIICVSFLMGISMLFTSYWQGSGKYHLSILFENFIPKFVLLILAILFFAFGKIFEFSEKYLLFYIIVYGAIAIPLSVHLIKGLNLSFRRSELISLLFFFGVAFTYNIGNELTKVLEGGLYNNNIVLATIAISTSIINLVSIFTNVLNNLTKPIFAKYARENNIDDLMDVYRFNTRMNAYIAVPFYLFFVFFSSNFLSLFGETYLQYPMILTIMAIANAVVTLTGPNGTMLAMTGHEKWELFNGLLYFGVYIAFVFVFSFDPIYGLTIALLLGQIIVNVAKFIETAIIFKRIPLDGKTLLSILIVLVVNGGLIFALSFIKIFWLWLVVGIILGICLILCNIFVITLYRKHDFKFLISLRV